MDNEAPKKIPPAFYKAPVRKTHNYEFPAKDREIKVIQQRFTPRTASASSPQVTEGGQASGSGIKLGDTITKINNMDTSGMTLAEAHSEIQASSKEIQLSVKSFEDEEEKAGDEREVTLQSKKGIEAPKKKVMQMEQPKGGTLEEQLRAMQKRLAEIAAIPIQIQATLENVTRTMENLLPTERSPVMSDEESDYGYEEIEQYDDSYRFDKKEEEVDSASDKTDDVDPLDTEDDVEEEAAAVSSASVSEICDNEPESGCVSATPEEDPQRPEGVWSSWPWSEQPKAVPRRSNCHLAARPSMIQNRIKQLNEKQVLAPYTRNEQNVGN